MTESNAVSRRRFLGSGAAVAAPLVVPAHTVAAEKSASPNDRIHVGLIGCGGMGRSNLAACANQPDVVVTAACDPWQQRRDAVVAQFQAKAARHTPTSARCSPRRTSTR